jgi:3-oxoacyl-[acyl-carrier protein] reductase
MIDLTGKRALVCGSTQGMGRACAMKMARFGAVVTLAARNAESLKKVLAELPADTGQKHATICQDFGDPVALQRKVADHIGASGSIHILLNNTGGPPAGKIVDANPLEFIDAFNKHVICNQLLAQTLLPGMKEAGYGRIINIISTSAKTPISGLGVSNTTRGAVANWAKTLAGEVAPFGITVNNILPGFIDTERLHEVIGAFAQQSGKSTDELEKAFIAQVPAGRFGQAEEIADVVAFLASAAASYVNGINVPVDGGRTPTL